MTLTRSPRPTQACVVLGAVVLWTTIVLVGATTPGYRPFADTVSRLGSAGQRHAGLARTGILMYGALTVGAALLVAYTATRARVVAGLVGAYGAAAVVAGLAPKDPPHHVHTTASQVHVDATIIGGTLLVLAMVTVARRASARLDRVLATGAAVLTVIGAAVFPFLWGSSVYGLVERALLAIATVWLLAIAWRLPALVPT